MELYFCSYILSHDEEEIEIFNSDLTFIEYKIYFNFELILTNLSILNPIISNWILLDCLSNFYFLSSQQIYNDVP